MPKSIYLTDEQYQQVVAAARGCGFTVRRGRGSQLASFVVQASNYCTAVLNGQADMPPKASDDDNHR